MIREVLSEAEMIAFLGFSFHPVNMKMLQFFGFGDPPKTCVACGYHMAEGERAAASKLMRGSITFGSYTSDALNFLKDTEILL